MSSLLRSAIAWIMIVVLVLSLSITSPVQADPGVEIPPAQTGPVVDISSHTDFYNIRNNLSGSYRLTANIDLSSYPNWAPLGNTAAPFTGSLDGNGFAIKNLTLANTQESNQGLFGVIDLTGSVSNLEIRSAAVSGADSTGILAGYNQGTISRVFAQGIVSGAVAVGGLVGTNSGSITNSHAMASVTGKNKNGGLVGINSGTLSDSYAVSTVSGTVTNNYIEFNGDDYISIPHKPDYITNSFTLEAWFQWTETDREAVQFITGKGLENFEIHTGDGTGVTGTNGIRFIPVSRTKDAGGSVQAYNDIHNALQPGWNHVAANWDYTNQKVRVFINGIQQHIYQNGIDVGLEATIPLTNPSVNPFANNTEEFFIGARNDQNYGFPGMFFKGNIADVRFWNRVRTAAEIAADKNKQLSGDETGLIGYWKLDEASGDTVYDSVLPADKRNNGKIYTFDSINKVNLPSTNATRVKEIGANGGLVGENTGTVNSSYYDTTVSNLTDTGKGEPRTTTQMKTAATFSGWDFTTIWKIGQGPAPTTYPTLFTIDVTLNKASGQADPSNASTVNFTAVFDESINPDSFTNDDVSISGSAGATTAVITQAAPNNGTTFNIAVSGMTKGGDVTVTIPAGKAFSQFDELNAVSTATDDTIIYDNTGPSVTLTQATSQADPTNTGPINFTAVFSEPVDLSSFTDGDVSLSGTAGATTAVITQVAPNNGTTFNVAVSGMTSIGTVIATIPAGKVMDLAGNLNTASTGADNTVTYDTADPTVTISSSASNPTKTSPIPVTITFSADVTGFVSSDLSVGNGTAGNFAGSGKTYTADITPTSNGTVTVDVPANSAVDSLNNGNTAAVQFSITYDNTGPSVTLTQASSQADPTDTGPINFTAVFSEPVDLSSFTDGDVSLSGTAGATTAVVSQIAPNNGTTFNVAVSGMTSIGTVIATIPAGKVMDLLGNLNTASTGADNTVTYDTADPTVTISSSASNPTKTSPIPVTITFSADVTGFVSSDLSVGNGTAGDFAGSGKTYTANITPTSNGTVTVDVPANSAVDSLNNGNTAAVQFSITYDNTGPSVTLTQASSQADPTNTGPINFTAVFSEPVDLSSFTDGDVSLSGTAGATTAVITQVAPNNGTTFNVAVSGMTSIGTVIATIPAGKVMDLAGNLNTASTGADNTVTYDTADPTATISSSASNPTKTSPIPVTITFSADVTGFVSSDLSVGNGTAGNFAGSGKTYTADITPTSNGTVTVDVPANSAVDSLNNGNTAAVQFSITYDNTGPSVTLTQASSQADPTNTGPINFTAVFSEPVDLSSFTDGDVSLSGTAGATTAVVSQITPNNGTTFNVAVSGMTSIGTVIATIPAGKVMDLAGNLNTASTGADNTVTYETVNPLLAQITLNTQFTSTTPHIFTLRFSEGVYNPAGDNDPDDVTNPANYLLVERGVNRKFDTVSCAGGVKTDDQLKTVSSVTYNDVTFTSTITLAKPLPAGTYRLFVCGTTSIVDLALNPLNGGTDTTYDFSVTHAPKEDETTIEANTLLPNSGFAPGKVVQLAEQPEDAAYLTSDMVLSIPQLKIKAPITGIPQINQQWDVSWLGNKAGYLHGSAYPTLTGNTVITGHVWNANDTPGIFANLKILQYGDQFHIYAFGQVFTYEVRENRLVTANNTTSVFKSEIYDWVTLLTCEGFNLEDDSYTSRRIVRAVLVNVK